MLDRDAILETFRKALEELKSEIISGPSKSGGRELTPRVVALRAHRLYCATLPSHAKSPSPDTFRKFATGQWPFPRVSALLAEAGVRTGSMSRLDRPRLRSVFEEAIQRLETRLLKGQAKPSQIARRAYELYTRAADASETKPSHRTFERLVYGKAADPEISSLVENALAKNRKDGL